MAKPMQAQAHNPAAVVGSRAPPAGRAADVPASRKPEPLITCAESGDDQRKPVLRLRQPEPIRQLAYSNWLSSMVVTAPIHTTSM
jgi:hypothetical protein